MGAAVNLRFLSGMVVRVKDNSKVQEVAGRTCRIQRLEDEGDLATVTVVREAVATDGRAVERVVKVTDLDPGLPEEGDLVASLHPEDGEEVGHLISLDDNDEAMVKFPDTEDLRGLQVERLCKVLQD